MGRLNAREIQGGPEGGRTVRVCAILIFMAACLSPLTAKAVDSGRLVEKDGQYVFVENQDPALLLLLERAREKGWITQEEYEKTLKESETHAYLRLRATRCGTTGVLISR